MKHPPRNIAIDWLNTIWSTDLPSNAKLVACCLRRYMNAQNDMAWPSIARIAGETSLSESSARRSLHLLRDDGWLVNIGHSNLKTVQYQASFPSMKTGGVSVTGVSERQSTPVSVTPELNNELNNSIRGWGEWVQYRKECKKKMTPSTIKKQVAMLEKYPPVVQEAIINQSITNGWTGLFPIKESRNGQAKQNTNNGRKLSGAERTRLARQRAYERQSAAESSDMGCVEPD